MLAPHGPVILDQNGFYHSCIAIDDTGAYCSVLIKFNYNGDIQWLKRFYSNEQGVNLYVYNIARSTDGGILLTGLYEDFNTAQEPLLLIKTDKDGNELWRKKINKNLPNVTSGHSLIQDSITKKIIVVGYQYIGTSSAFSTYSSIVILDSLGNKISQNTFNNSDGGGFGHIIQLRDGNFLTGGQWASSSNYYTALLVKFNINGYIIWQKKFPETAPLNNVGLIYETLNRDIFILGKSDNSSIVYPQVFFLDSAGNLK